MGANRGNLPGYVPWGYRSQIGAHEWGGCCLDGDASSPPPNMFRGLLNVRRRGGNMDVRGGEAVINDSTLVSGASVVGGYMLPEGFIPWTYLSYYTCLGTLQYYMLRLSSSSNDYAATAISGLYETPVLAMYNFNLYVAVGNVLMKSSFPGDTVGETHSVTNASQTYLSMQHIARFDGWDNITWMQEFDGYLFIALGGTGNTKIVAYDGQTLTDDVTGIGVGNLIGGGGVWQDKLVVGFSAGSSNNVRVRNSGAPPGTWNTVAPGAGTVRFFQKGVCLGANLYWGGGITADIWYYDGTNVAIARTLTTGVAPRARNVIRLGHVMYYLNWPDSTEGCVVGVTDGTTWVDGHKSFSIAGHILAKHAGAILLCGGVTTPTARHYVYQSPGTDTAGSWTKAYDRQGYNEFIQAENAR